MPKPNTFPTLYDQVLRLNICKLKKCGSIRPGQICSSTVCWSRNGNRIASIGITVDMCAAQPYVDLDYSYNDIPRKYRVRLVSVLSNLGSGEIWYFLCPHTNKRCRILYMIGGWFLHRETFKGVYYDSQIQSKKMRALDRLYGPLFNHDKYYDELYKPYFKPYYKGKPTKRYIRINKKLNEASCVSAKEFEKALIECM